MAIIKTKLVNGDRRIITKVVGGQRRVSCSCCETGCCMYPAIAYTNALYEFEDLPDEVEFWHNDGAGGALVGPIIVPKNGSAGEFFYGGETDFSPRISHFTDEWLVGVNQIDPGLGDCLILDKLTIEPAPAAGDGTRSIWVFDRFEDIYTIDVAGGATDELSRNSLCVWGGSQSGYLAYYDGNDGFIESYYNGPPHKWIFIRGTLQPDESGGVWEKDSPQNGPEGTYSPSSNAGDFAGIGSVTVSPA